MKERIKCESGEREAKNFNYFMEKDEMEIIAGICIRQGFKFLDFANLFDGLGDRLDAAWMAVGGEVSFE